MSPPAMPMSPLPMSPLPMSQRHAVGVVGSSACSPTGHSTVASSTVAVSMVTGPIPTPPPPAGLGDANDSSQRQDMPPSGDHERALMPVPVPVPVTGQARWLRVCCEALPGAHPWVVTQNLTQDPNAVKPTYGSADTATATATPSCLTPSCLTPSCLTASCLLAVHAQDGAFHISGPASLLGRDDPLSLAASNAQTAHDLATALARQLRALPGPWQLRLEQLPHSQPTAAFAATICDELSTTLRPGRPIPRVVFGQDRALNTYLTRGVRRTLRKARNRLDADQLPARFQLDDDPAAVASLLDRIQDAHRQRDHDGGRRSDLDQPAHRRWWRSVICEHANAGLVEATTLWLGGELAAYTIVLRDLAADPPARRVFDSRCVSRFARYAPGRLLEAQVLAHALADPGCVLLDWMTSTAPEALLAVNQFEPMSVIVAHAPPSPALPPASAPAQRPSGDPRRGWRSHTPAPTPALAPWTPASAASSPTAAAATTAPPQPSASPPGAGATHQTRPRGRTAARRRD